MTYHIGDIARLKVQFTDINKVPADPSTVSITVEDPDTIETVYSTMPPIVRDGVGAYHFDLSVTKSGIYAYRWAGTGVIVAANEGSITVKSTIFDGSRPSPIDLCTIDQIKSWMAQNNCSTQDIDIQREVTGVSAWWLWRTGHGPADGSFPTQSLFVSPVAFNEYYDGNGNDRLFLRQSPIVSVQALNANGVSIPLSTGFGVPGFSIDTNGRSLVMRNSGYRGVGGRYYGGGGFTPSRYGIAYCFYSGTQNIQVQYTAGYARVPPDVTSAVIKILSLWLKKRQWIGQKQQSLPDSLGTTVYTDLEVPVEVVPTINFYSRRAAV